MPKKSIAVQMALLMNVANEVWNIANEGRQDVLKWISPRQVPDTESLDRRAKHSFWRRRTLLAKKIT